MSDQFDGIFDELKPDDFSGVTSWRHHLKNFDEFVQTGVLTTRMAFLSSEGQVNPSALLATKKQVWIYTPDDDENLNQYFARLKGEAERIGATWFYVFRRTLVANKPSDSQIPDVADPEAIGRAIEENALVDGVYYFASRREGDDKEYRHGIMKAHGNRLGEQIDGDPMQTVNFLAKILD